MKYILLLFSLIHFFFGYSQKNYIDYQRVIVKAEDEILNENFTEAYRLYDSVFQSFPKHFSKDLYNAAICATYSKEYKKAKDYLLELANKGVLSYYFYSRAFKPLRKQKGWREFKNEYKLTLDKARIRFKNDEEARYIDSLNAIDQKFRMMKGGYSVYGDTIAKIDSLNEIAIRNYLIKNGYPDGDKFLCEKIGGEYWRNKSYVIIRHLYQNRTPNNHYVMNKNEETYLTEILENELINGNLSPYVFAELEEKKSNNLKLGNKYGIVVYFRVKGKMYGGKIPQNVNFLNENRWKIGLESYEGHIKRINFKRSMLKPFYFEIAEGIVNVSGISKKDAAKFL